MTSEGVFMVVALELGRGASVNVARTTLHCMGMSRWLNGPSRRSGRCQGGWTGMAAVVASEGG